MISAEGLRDKLFGPEDYPYKIYEKKIDSALKQTDIVLDAGCGRQAPLLKEFRGKAKMLIGADVEERMVKEEGISLMECDISNVCLKDESVDLVISRSVLEHLKQPLAVYKELNRILKPGGSFIFLVPNLGHYASLLSLLIPDRYHAGVLKPTGERQKDDFFPVYYKSNTYSAIKRLSKMTGFEISDFQYLGQYPYYFMFSTFLFLVASAYIKIINRWNCFAFLRGCIFAHLTKKGYIAEKISIA